MNADLWTFATTLYARPGVEAACLELQDAGADVCLLLAGLWLDSRDVAHGDEREARLRALAGTWQRQVVVPLRSLRQGWRDAAADDAALATLRQRLKQLELDAERTQLERLQELSSAWPADGPARRTWLDALAVAGGARERLLAATAG
ncbi:TIGR02444 family protein [Pseudomonas flavescens]|uniref:TIGR02444 family protein n=1 Tax=Phytopseudomonas flavescens TaxID=29435 RepID=A0A1G8PFN2_9GAMM|nr:TIGR02444 family protein [Pseudomonas flavescens]SDI91242.1 TIGR02444 family protein [Pseudomonas flavescens]